MYKIQSGSHPCLPCCWGGTTYTPTPFFLIDLHHLFKAPRHPAAQSNRSCNDPKTFSGGLIVFPGDSSHSDSLRKEIGISEAQPVSGNIQSRLSNIPIYRDPQNNLTIIVFVHFLINVFTEKEAALPNQGIYGSCITGFGSICSQTSGYIQYLWNAIECQGNHIDVLSSFPVLVLLYIELSCKNGILNVSPMLKERQEGRQEECLRGGEYSIAI